MSKSKPWTSKPRRRRVYQRGTRFDPWRIGKRLEDRRRDLDIPIKEICEEMQMDRADWSRKWRVARSSFSLPEISDILDIFDRKSGKPSPPGFPFIDYNVALLLERIAKE